MSANHMDQIENSMMLKNFQETIFKPTKIRNCESQRITAAENIEQVQTYNKNSVDKIRKKPYEYCEGDYVMWENIVNIILRRQKHRFLNYNYNYKL